MSGIKLWEKNAGPRPGNDYCPGDLVYMEDN